jgi:hypothetical protein
MSKLEIPDELKYLKGLRYEPAMRIDYQNLILEDILTWALLCNPSGPSPWER